MDCISRHDYNHTNFTARDYLTGPRRSTFNSNVGNHEREGSDQLLNTNFENFLDLFSIVFAAFSGFLSGVNLTGEVRNPGTMGTEETDRKTERCETGVEDTRLGLQTGDWSVETSTCWEVLWISHQQHADCAKQRLTLCLCR